MGPKMTHFLIKNGSKSGTLILASFWDLAEGQISGSGHMGQRPYLEIRDYVPISMGSLAQIWSGPEAKIGQKWAKNGPFFAQKTGQKWGTLFWTRIWAPISELQLSF